jgi:hypothetical protein
MGATRARQHTDIAASRASEWAAQGGQTAMTPTRHKAAPLHLAALLPASAASTVALATPTRPAAAGHWGRTMSLLALFFAAAAPNSRAGDEYRVERWAVAAAGGPQQASTAAGGVYRVLSTAGQGYAPGLRVSRGSDCIGVHDGFWAGRPRATCVSAFGGIAMLLLLAALAATLWRRRAGLRQRRLGATAGGVLALASLFGSAVPAALAVPSWIDYQGKLLLNEQAPIGGIYAKFALIDHQSESLWTNDGQLPEPAKPLGLPLSEEGHFFARIGTGLHTDGSPVAPLPVAELAGRDLRLRVWVSGSASGPFNRLEPDLLFSAVPYAFEAIAAREASTLQGKVPADFSASGHKHGAGDITSGTLAPERIATGSITGAKIADAALGGQHLSPSISIDTSGTLAAATLSASSQLRLGGTAVSATASQINQLPALTSGGETSLHHHDGRYRTRGELQGTTSGQGASLIGVQPGSGLSSSNVQAALVELKSSGSVTKTLQSAYEDGHSILASAAQGELTISDSETGSFNTLKLSKTGDVPGEVSASALRIEVPPGVAPISVNSPELAPNLNAEFLEGQASAFYRDAGNLNAGTMSDERLSSSVTLQSNTFNGASQLVRLDANTPPRLPAVSGLNLTNLNASNLASGTVNNDRLSSSVTLQSNTFNGASQLVRLDASSPPRLPAVSGVNLTNLSAGNLASGTVPSDRLSGTYSSTLTFSSVSNVFRGMELDSGTNQALDLKVNGQRALRLEPNATSPNVIGGFSGNTISAGVVGAVISGGGSPTVPRKNEVTADFGTVAGGLWNTAGGGAGASVGGGGGNQALATGATVSGGNQNHVTAQFGTIGGGDGHRVTDEYGTVGGGRNNRAGNNAGTTTDSTDATVAGGSNNVASGTGSTIGGGANNIASGDYSTIPGGTNNEAGVSHAFAAGCGAKANSGGAFVWADASVGCTSNFIVAPASNTFTVRASGGIWLGTNSSPSIPGGRFIQTSTSAFLTDSSFGGGRGCWDRIWMTEKDESV